MCEANAYLIEEIEENDEEERIETLIMESVDTIEPEDDGLLIVNIFGEQKFMKAYIHSLSLVDHKVFLKKK